MGGSNRMGGDMVQTLGGIWIKVGERESPFSPQDRGSLLCRKTIPSNYGNLWKAPTQQKHLPDLRNLRILPESCSYEKSYLHSSSTNMRPGEVKLGLFLAASPYMTKRAS